MQPREYGPLTADNTSYGSLHRRLGFSVDEPTLCRPNGQPLTISQAQLWFRESFRVPGRIRGKGRTWRGPA